MDGFFVDHTEWEPNVDREEPWPLHVAHVKRHPEATPPRREHQTVARSELPLGCFNELRFRPGGELSRRCEQIPDSIGRRAYDLRRAHPKHHRTVSLTPRRDWIHR